MVDPTTRFRKIFLGPGDSTAESALVIEVEGDKLPTYEVTVDTVGTRTDITVVGPMSLEEDGTVTYGHPEGSIRLQAHTELDEQRRNAVAVDLALVLRRHFEALQPPSEPPASPSV